MKKILIIQTAFIGDVILSTSLVEELRRKYPDCELHYLVRKGNEGLLDDNPGVSRVWVWDKSKKYKSLLSLMGDMKKNKYDIIYNLQRYATMGFFTLVLKADKKVGFETNPVSTLFTKKVSHHIPHAHPFQEGKYLHEVQRNYRLISDGKIPERKSLRPKLYFNEDEKKKVRVCQESPYFVLAPSSVWFTKQWPEKKWGQLAEQLSSKGTVYLIGAKDDQEYCEKIRQNNPKIQNLCGKLSLKESALLMKKAERSYVNDSAPLHLASAVNAPVTAIFCSTIPEFGYGPLSDDSLVASLTPRLECMPCGLHGKKECPLEHFKCGEELSIEG